MSFSERFACGAQWVSSAAGKPVTFCAALGSVAIWAAFGPLTGYSEPWMLVINTMTTIVTFLMVFLIQASQNRDGAAIQAKLDTLIAGLDKADNHLIGIEKTTELSS